MRIWKFPLMIADEQTIAIPQSSRPLCVQVQNGIPCMWAMVDPDAPEVHMRVMTFGTGQGVPMLIAMDYVGTYQHGPFVGHVFLWGAGE